jgi:lipopolysaccharide transport system permease protein
MDRLAAPQAPGYSRAMRPQTSPDASPVYLRDATEPRRLERGVGDLATGFARWRLAAALARLDVRNRYRGSVLGPFWLTVSVAIMVTGLGFLYAVLFKMSLREYLPWIAVSLLIWNTINQIVTESCSSLTSAEGIIRQLPLPYTVHALRCVMRNLVVAAHSLPLILVVFAVCGIIPGPEALLALLGLVLITLNAFAAALFLGMVCARFRDIAQMVASALQFIFFVSPVIWKPEMLGANAAWLLLNPIFVLMETMRAPLIEGGGSALIWGMAVFYTAAFCGIAFAFFVRFRGRIAFWV